MELLLNAEQSRKLDRYMITEQKIPGLILMENAAITTTMEIIEHYDISADICVVCGTGNNGGDGFAIARALLIRGCSVSVVLVGDEGRISGDALVNYNCLKKLTDIFHADTADTLYEIEELICNSQILVDAIFGTGLDRPVRDIYESVIHMINESDAKVVSVDIPSGVNSDTGQILGMAVCADITVTYQKAKIGHFLYPGAGMAGQLHIAPIGNENGFFDDEESNIYGYTLFDDELVICKRARNTNKGDYGKLLIIAGHTGMSGAAYLSAAAASRSGAGLVTLLSSDSVTQKIQTALPEILCGSLPSFDGQICVDDFSEIDRYAEGKNAILIGPGLGTGDGPKRVVRYFLENFDVCKIFDADALNIISGDIELLNDAVGDIVITPHPKEFSRLTGLSVRDILSDPVTAVKNFANYYGVTVLLKGASTVISDGFDNTGIVSYDVPAMAKGGSGDVLSGIIAGLMAQNDDVFSSALMGAEIHLGAGYLAQKEHGEYSVIARDIIRNIGYSISKFPSAESESWFSDEYADTADDGVYVISDDSAGTE